MKVLGVSGSPIKESNTDRAVKYALQATGLETEFIKLSDYEIEPCRGCLACAHLHRCVIDDDGAYLAEKVKESDGLIIGGFTPYSSLDSRTKAFIERMYPNRHGEAHMKGKPGGAVITYAVPQGAERLPPAADYGINAISFFMMEEEMDVVGDVRVKGVVPCVKCGKGDDCETSGIKMLYGSEATIESIGCGVFEKQVDAVASAESLGRAIRAKLTAVV